MARIENARQIRAVALGVSTGGVEALRRIIGALPADFAVPVLAVIHVAPESGNGLATLLDELCAITVKEADELETPRPGHVYLAPPNYHLQVEGSGLLSLSVDAPVNFARPSVDVLFETAADAYGPELVGVVLTGAGCDGAHGLVKVRERGGITVIQDPDDAECDSMPRHALQLVVPDHRVRLAEVAPLLIQLTS